MIFDIKFQKWNFFVDAPKSEDLSAAIGRFDNPSEELA